VEERIQNKEEAFRIHKALHYLDEPYKEVFALRIFGELSFIQISKLFGKTENWARVTFHRAKIKIKDMLKEEENK
jgi:RNA polymerase sigma-70 factor (ECF subfamily)